MAARQGNTRLVTDGTTAANHLTSDFRSQYVDRPAENRNRHQRITAHRVDVADGIGGGDATEIKRIIDNRHEKIGGGDHRSEEHTSELQSLMRISYAVFCLKKKKNIKNQPHINTQRNRQ